MVESGFIEINGQLLPPEAIKPLSEVSGTTSVCSIVRIDGRRLFMKRLRPELAGHSRYVALMRKEYEIGSMLSHPNLVQYISMNEDVDGPYLLTAYVDGETLAMQIRKWRTVLPPPVRVFGIFFQILDCLSYLHCHQVVHLDLKPDNIMLSRVGDVVKLIDLGFCYSDGYDLSMGRNAVYSAPEQQHTNGRPDHRADIYAVGKLLEMVIDLLPNTYSHKLHQIVQCSTDTDPADRYQSAAEMKAALEACTHRRLSWWRHWLWVFSLAVIALIGYWTVCQRLAVSTVDDHIFSSSQYNSCFRILSADSLTCSAYGIHYIGPDSNMMIYPMVKHEGLNYAIIEVADSAFCQSDQIRYLSLGEGIRSIGIDACYECENLVSVSLPSTLTTIHPGAFSSCHRLRELLLPSHLKNIGHGAFVGTYALRHITIPEGVTCLPTDCFVSSGIETVTLPSTLRVLERGVFYDCHSLRSIVLPAGIERIGEYCFMRCDSLREVTVLAPVPPAITNVFANTTGIRRTLFVPKGSIEAYQQAPYWQEFAEIRVIN